MSGFLSGILKFFGLSGSVSSVPLYSLRPKMAQWKKYRSYPSYYELPASLSFSSSFWMKVKEIHRHTLGDKHERAIGVWWADDDFVVTENVRGGTKSVKIPAQKVRVKFEYIKGTSRAQRIITVNGKVYSKRTYDKASLKYKKNVEVEHLFNMHTHPPHSRKENNELYYNFFSETDIRSLLKSPSVFSGLVTDRLWLLAKTANTPKQLDLETGDKLTPEYLTKELHLKVYLAQFGKHAMVIRPEGYG